MRPKLTQYLIDKGYVTEDQCSEALQRQVIFGGRIGTNLLELFYITEDQLIEALSHTLHVPITPPDQLEKLDPSVIRLIPEDLARKYRVVPFEHSKGRVHLAMTDPTNMEALDEIGFITGKVIKPYITTEVKMGFLLEKNYGIRREMRFISIPEEEKKRRMEWEDKKRKREEQQQAQDKAEQQDPKPSASKAIPTSMSRAVLAIAGLSPNPLDLTTFDGASQNLSQANNRDEIADTLLAFANFRLERAVLFVIKGDQVQAWKVGGVWRNSTDAETVHFPLKEPSVVHDVADSKQLYKGPLLEIPRHKEMIEILGGNYPKEAVAFPMAIRKRVFSVLYGDNAISNEGFRELDQIQRVLLKAALSFEVLILKAKILFQH